jgi:hypothetical protein
MAMRTHGWGYKDANCLGAAAGDQVVPVPGASMEQLSELADELMEEVLFPFLLVF